MLAKYAFRGCLRMHLETSQNAFGDIRHHKMHLEMTSLDGAEWKPIRDVSRCIWTQRNAFGEPICISGVGVIITKCILFVPRCIWWFEIPKRVSTHPNAFGDEMHLGCNTTTNLIWDNLGTLLQIGSMEKIILQIWYDKLVISMVS
jgi:hypothetical protein